MPFVLHRKFPRALSLIHNMRHQAQVPLNQYIPRLQIPLPAAQKKPAFLLLCQGLGEAPGGQLQGAQQRAQHQPCGTEHNITSAHCIRHCPSFFHLSPILTSQHFGRLYSQFFYTPFSFR